MLRSDYTKALLGAGAIFLVIVLYVFEMVHFNNTMNVKTMVFISLVLGLVLGLLLATRFRKYGEESIEVFQIFVMVTLLTMAVMPLLVGMSNRLLTYHDLKKEKVEFVQSEAYISSRFGHLPDQKPDGYHTFIIYNNRLERIKSKENPFPNTTEGSTVDLSIRKGLWGFEYFDLLQ